MTPKEIEQFIQTNRCLESEFEKGEYYIGESKIKSFLLEMLYNQLAEIKILESKLKNLKEIVDRMGWAANNL